MQEVEYIDAYAPVVSLSIVRLFICLVNFLGLECDQMIVVTVFLKRELHEKIYMEVPSGIRDFKKPNQVCRLLKALYGLKMAPRQWFAKIHYFWTSQLNFVSSPHEPFLYTFRDRKVFLAIVLFVDDLLNAESNLSDLA